jgi:hypothetical protein
MKNKRLKIAGNILTGICVVLLFYRLIRLEFDWSLLLSPRNLLVVLVILLLYAGHLILLPVVWRQTLRMTTGQNCPYAETAFVYLRSNLMKYLPGNVFQYVGRNEIALRRNLSHVDVALSTLLEIAAMSISVVAMACVLYLPGLKIWLETTDTGKLKWSLLLAVGLLLLATGIVWFMRGRLSRFLLKIKSLLTLKNARNYFLCILYYAFWASYNSFLFVMLLRAIFGLSLSVQETTNLMGTFLFSWLVGFLAPGTPGGIGVREFVIVTMMSGRVGEEIIIPGILVYRIITTAGDFMAFAVARLLLYIQCRREKSEP